jgi:hypothetical protein
MTLGLRALLAAAIDYAGLFPPARLPLDQALRRYAAHRRSADAWMLGRFVCPAARLAELAPFLDELFADEPLAVSALGGPAGLEADLAAVRACLDRHGGWVLIDALETKAPGPDAAELKSAAPALAEIDAVYFEHTLGPDWQGAVPEFASALRAVNDGLRGEPGASPVGFKLRCGGLEASAFPSVLQVAVVLLACRAEGVPLKLTAGLHHPLRRPDPETGATMHGFVNVLAAAALHRSHGLEAATLCEILADADPDDFSFDDDGLCWRNLRATLGQLEESRRQLTVSFGSCSFDEPRDDLRALGWLEGGGP